MATLVATLGAAGLVSLLLSAPDASPPADRHYGAVAETLAFIKQFWPQTGEAVLTEDARIEYRDGTIRFGKAALAEIAAGDSDSPDPVLTFVVAHEAWHSIQAQRYSTQEIDRLGRERILECEADFMAGVAVAKRLQQSGITYLGSYPARSRIARFLQANAQSKLSNTLYLSPRNRERVMHLGWYYVGKPKQFRFAMGKSNDDSQVARRICQFAARENDGSARSIGFSAFTDSPIRHREQTVTTTVELSSYADAPAQVSYMLVFEFTYMYHPERNRVFRIIVESFRIRPRAKLKKTYTFSLPADTTPMEVRTADNWWGMSGRDTDEAAFITTRLLSPSTASKKDSSTALPQAASDYCYARLANVNKVEDRALFSRLATVALAAAEDFEPVRSSRPQGTFLKNYREYPLVAGVGRSDGDRAIIDNGDPRIEIQAFGSSSKEKADEELARLRTVLEKECAGSASTIVELGKGISVDNFSPMTTLSLEYNRSLETPTHRVYFKVRRQPTRSTSEKDARGSGLSAARLEAPSILI